MNIYNTLSTLRTWDRVQAYAQEHKPSNRHEYTLGYATSLVVYKEYAYVSHHGTAIFVVWCTDDKEFLPYPSRTTQARLRALGIPINQKNHQAVFTGKDTPIPLTSDGQTWYTLSKCGNLALKYPDNQQF